jgi:hypothetical protein
MLSSAAIASPSRRAAPSVADCPCSQPSLRECTYPAAAQLSCLGGLRYVRLAFDVGGGDYYEWTAACDAALAV